MTDAERVIGALEWMKGDIEKNEHYQIALYPEILERAVRVMSELSAPDGQGKRDPS